MSAADSTTYSAALKRLYPQTDVTRAQYENNPLFAMMPKKYDMFGESMHLAIRFAQTAGRSATFSNAKANKVSSALDKWLVTIVQDYSLYSVTGKLARQTSNQKGAIIDALQEEVDSALDAMNRSFGMGVFRNGGGAIGQIASGSGTATITLKDANQVVGFEKNMWLNTSTTDGTSGSVKAGLVQVQSVDRDAGTVTVVGANWAAGIPTVADNDFIFQDGDFGQKMKGLDAWLPATAPTGGDSFFGMDRSQDPVRLAGTRIDGRGRLIEEAVKLALQKAYRNGARISHIFMNDSNFLDLDLSLGSRRLYVDTKEADVGFTGIKFTQAMSGGKPVEIYPDPNCPFNVAYGLTMSDWSIRGPGQFPFIEERDGNRILREDAADAFEGRIVSYHQAMCQAPGRSFRLQLG